MTKQKGFTLIELLVVIAIIGLLATLGVVAFGSAQQKAREAKRVADVRSVVEGLSAAYTDNSALTLGTKGCVATTLAANTTVANSDICNGLNTPVTAKYINFTNVKDPTWANATSTVIAATAGTGVATANEEFARDYTFNSNSTISSFVLGFDTETSGNQGLSPTTTHYANQNGLVQ